MPLIKGKSKKSFDKNVETEMHHDKPLKQALAIAYDIQRRAKKKAHGGSIHGGKAEADREPKSMHPGAKDHYMKPSEKEFMSDKAKMLAKGGMINEEESFEKAEHTDEPKGMHPGAKKHYMKPSEKEIMSQKFPKGHVGPHDDSEDAPSEAEYLGMDATGKHRFKMGGKVFYAEGGKVEDEHSQHPEHFIEEEEHEVDEAEHPHTIVDGVMKKRKKMADGGYATEASKTEHLRKRKYMAEGGAVEDEHIDDPFDADGEAITHFGETGPGTRQKFNMEARKFKAGDDRQLKKQPHGSNLKGDKREHDEENIDDEDMISKIMKKKRGY